MKNKEKGESLLFTVKEFNVTQLKNGELCFRIQITNNQNNFKRMGFSFSAPFNMTQREIEVLEKLSKGKSNLQIANELYISIHTVKAHVSSILNKLNVDNRVNASIKAISENILKK